MTRTRRRKCRCCGQLYEPDPRNRYHQRYCDQPACRRASKAASRQRWRASPKGRDYFRGQANRQRVKAWQQAHPGYWRRRRQRSRALQDHCRSQVLVLPGVKATLTPRALQAKGKRDITDLERPCRLGGTFAPGGLAAKTSSEAPLAIRRVQRYLPQHGATGTCRTHRPFVPRHPARRPISSGRTTCRSKWPRGWRARATGRGSWASPALKTSRPGCAPTRTPAGRQAVRRL